MDISFQKLIDDSNQLAQKVIESGKKYDAVYGIPAGGLVPAFIISQELGLPLVSEISENKNVLVVDDLIDSGKTINSLREKHGDNFDVVVVYKKDVEGVDSSLVDIVKEIIPNEWINLPHESLETPIEDNIVRILEYIGEDPKREGLIDTPKRVIKSYDELFKGYSQDINDILTVFDSEGYDQMVALTDIEFNSTCEHHIIPFLGKAHVAYIPDKKIVGISKLARIVDMFAHRLQNQERLTQQIGDLLQKVLKPKGVAVVMEAQHMCMKCRGVGKQNSIMKTAYLTGVFRDDSNNARSEFYQLINKK